MSDCPTYIIIRIYQPTRKHLKLEVKALPSPNVSRLTREKTPSRLEDDLGTEGEEEHREDEAEDEAGEELPLEHSESHRWKRRDGENWIKMRGWKEAEKDGEKGEGKEEEKKERKKYNRIFNTHIYSF